MFIDGNSDKGKVREMNQDYFAVDILSDGAAFLTVCDGMGGANAGNIAAKTAVRHIDKKVHASYNEKMNSNGIRLMLSSAVISANLEVFGLSRSDERYSGMGTTVITAVIRNGIIHLLHAGDSRAYIYSDAKIKQITRDHSIVQYMIEQGLITKEEAKHHPKRNVITRALGVGEALETDYNEIPLCENEILLVCSDGLTNYVDDADIARIINSKNSEKEIVGSLIKAANDNGGGDNITVVIASE